MSNLHDHAVTELEASGWAGSDGFYGDLVANAVLEIVKVFDDQGHSGMSASVVIALLEKILRFEPVAPLTGEPNEWAILGYDDGLYAQNKRCSRVFMRKDGTAYDIRGRVFREPNGVGYTSSESHVDVTFPYTPTTEYVNVPFEEED